MRLVVAVVSCTLFAAGCGGSERPVSLVATWDGPVPPYPASGVLPVAAFRAYQTAVDEPWEQTPEDVSVEYVQPDRFDAQLVSASWDPVEEGVVDAVVLAQKLPDDSVRDLRFVLRLRLDREGNVWVLQSARWSQRCWPGRGHQSFSTQFCV